MEINNKIVGAVLTEIQKRDSLVHLFFQNPDLGQKIKLTFEGLLFETASPAVKRRVERVESRDILGFIAMTQLNHQGLNSHDYKQLLIQMDGSTNEYKIELICVFKQYKLTVASISKPRKQLG